MSQFTAQLYGPMFAGGGATVAFTLGAEALVLCPGEGREQQIAWSALTLRCGGFQGDAWLLEWQTPEGLASLALTSPEARQALLTQAPPALRTQLDQVQHQQRRARRRSRLGWSLLALLILSPLLVVLLFWWQADPLINWVVGNISIEKEQQLGELFYAQSTAGMKMIEQGPALDFVQKTGARLTQGSVYNFQWHVVDNPAVNAFAVPGGHVVVFTGLLKTARTPEEVAGVLAHEAQHVLQRHSLRAMVQAVGWQTVLSLAVGDYGGGLTQELATQLGTLQFGRRQETDADLKGIQLLRQAQISAQGMLDFFARLSQQEGPQLVMLSTHPPSAERLATLRSALQQQGQYPVQPLTTNWSAVQASLP